MFSLLVSIIPELNSHDIIQRDTVTNNLSKVTGVQIIQSITQAEYLYNNQNYIKTSRGRELSLHGEFSKACGG